MIIDVLVDNYLYIFDIDGVMTYPRTPMSDEQIKIFEQWMPDKKFIFITGSDYRKIIEQIPQHIRQAACMIFACLGNELWVRDTLVESSTAHFSENLIEYLGLVLKASKYPKKCGNHLEFRTGLVNFSTVGRAASQRDREEYFAWDCKEGERIALIQELRREFPKYDFQLGGQISIDVTKNGQDKGQVYEHLKEVYSEPFAFYGDRVDMGGNDYPLARKFKAPDIVHKVRSINGFYNGFKDDWFFTRHKEDEKGRLNKV